MKALFIEMGIVATGAAIASIIIRAWSVVSPSSAAAAGLPVAKQPSGGSQS